MKNYYKILQVDPSANLEVLNGAYRARVKQCHPDRYHTRMKHLMHEQMADINEAYHVLQDTERRARYDADFRHWQQTAASASGDPSLAAPVTGSKLFTPSLLVMVGLVSIPVISAFVFQGRLPVLFISILVYMGLMFKRCNVSVKQAIKPLLFTILGVVILGRYWLMTPLLLRLLIVLGGFIMIRRFAMKAKA